MLHHHTGSYYDEYRRKKSAEKRDAGKSHLEATEHNKLLTDRSSVLILDPGFPNNNPLTVGSLLTHC